MSNSSSSMIITSRGLSGVSGRLLNSKTFDSSKIVTVGSPLVLNGEGSSFSEDNYFLKSNLTFSESDKIEIIFEGIYGSEGSYAWSMTSSDETLSLYVSEESIALDSTLTGRILGTSNVRVKPGSSIKIIVNLTEQVSSMLVYIDSNFAEEVIQDYTFSDFSMFKTLYLGINLESPEKFWKGNIKLNNFLILKNDEDYYSPSSSTPFKFTKILISDGSSVLTDDSIPLLDKVSECEVTEISRTENNILLKANIDANVKMNIKEVGLYCEIGNEQVLFSTISGLSINKTVKLNYSLVLHAKLDIDVVNTVIKPEITVESEESSTISDFHSVRRTYVNSIPCLERIIKGNALGLGSYNSKEDILIENEEGLEMQTLKNFENNPLEVLKMSDYKGKGVGYNRPQVLYRVNDKIRENKDGYSAALNYSLIRRRCDLKQRTIFNRASIMVSGNVSLSPEGISQNFNSDSYISSTAFAEDMRYFKFDLGFKVKSFNEEVETICCLVNDSAVNNPMILYIKNGVLRVKIGQLEKLVASKDGKQFTFTRSSYTGKGESTEYYAWNYEGEVEGIPRVLYTLKREPSIGDELYEVQNDTFVPSSSLAFSYFTSKVLLDTGVVRVKVNENSKVRIIFDGNYYKFFFAEGTSRYLLKKTIMAPFNMNAVGSIVFGVEKEKNELKNAFSGEIFLKEFLFETRTRTFTFTKAAEDNIANLKDYYHFPVIRRNFLKIKNLGNNNFLLKESESFNGNGDSLNFGDTKGCSMCAKVILPDTQDRVILTKLNRNSKSQFLRLEVLDSSLIFSIFFDTETVVLKRKINKAEIGKFVGGPILITVLRSRGSYEGTYKMFLNEECIVADRVPKRLSQNSSLGYLSNYLEEPAESNCVLDILTFEGELSEDDIHFVNSVMDSRI